MLDSSNEPLLITKREINDKSMAISKLISLLLTGNMCLTKTSQVMHTMNF